MSQSKHLKKKDMLVLLQQVYYDRIFKEHKSKELTTSFL